MYAGSTGPSGIHQLALEVLSNSFDLVLGRRAARIDVALGSDGSITVADDGPGMALDDPTGAVIERFVTEIRDQPTADGHWPHLHLAMGLGLGPVCAMTSTLEVETKRADGTFRQAFSRGEPCEPLTVAEPEPGGVTGTTVRIVPDPILFGGARADPRRVATDLEELAELHPGLVTSLAVDEEPVHVFGPVADLSDLFTRLYADRRSTTPPEPPMLLSATGDDFAVDLALDWSRHRYRVEVRSYGNYRRTTDDSREVAGLEEGLREVFGAGPMKELMAGLQAVLHLKLADPKFPGPTKQRLVSPEATWIVADLIAAQLPPLLAERPELEASLRARSHTRSHVPTWEDERRRSS